MTAITEASSPQPRGPTAARAYAGRRTLFLLAAVMLAPVVASYTAFYLFPRDAKTNYGTLLATVLAPAIAGARSDGSPFRLEDLRGRWVLVASGGADCQAQCRRQLYAMRQARTMQGKEQDRVVRAWLVVGDATPSAALLAQHPELVVVRVADTLLAKLPGGMDALYLIDPLGNLVLRYPADPDIKGIARDLTRLLAASRIG